MIFYNADIITCNPDHPYAEAMRVENNRIVAVGDLKSMVKSDDEKMHNLNGKTVLPGFFDAHAHLWKIGDLLTFNLDLRGVKSISEIQQLLSDFNRKNLHLKWIRARGFNESLMDEKRLPTKEDIDKIVSDKPVFLQRTCAHIATLNSAALEVCGITKETQAPFGGEILYGADGNPNGVLTETALGLAVEHFPKITPADYEKMIIAAGKEFLKYGVTSVSDPAVMPDLLEVYKKMDREGKLPLRVHAFPIVIPDGATENYSIPDPYTSDMLVINTVKFFADGGLSGKTAAISRPYRNATGKGVLRLEKERFLKLALKAQEKGMQIATHAIGDVAIDLVLEVYQELYRIDPNAPKHRIEHLGLPTKKQLETIAELGIHVVTQPVFITELGKNFRTSLDDAFLNVCYGFRSMLEKGINVSFSTDAPVVKDLNPFTGIKAAVDRKDAEGFQIAAAERIGIREAIRCYTTGSALASRVQGEVGSLAVGKKADFVVLDRDPFRIPTDELTKIKATEVWLSGKRVVNDQ